MGKKTTTSVSHTPRVAYLKWYFKVVLIRLCWWWWGENSLVESDLNASIWAVTSVKCWVDALSCRQPFPEQCGVRVVHTLLPGDGGPLPALHDPHSWRWASLPAWRLPQGRGLTQRAPFPGRLHGVADVPRLHPGPGASHQPCQRWDTCDLSTVDLGLSLVLFNADRHEALHTSH